MGADKKVRKRIISKDKETETKKEKKNGKQKTSSSKGFLLPVMGLLLVAFLCTYYFEVIDYEHVLGLRSESDSDTPDEPQRDEAVSSPKEPVKPKESGGKPAAKAKPKAPEQPPPPEKTANEDEITSDADRHILAQIHEGEKLVKRRKVSEAVSFFEKLFKSNPDSPRARYGLAKAMIKKAEKERSNAILKASIEHLSETTLMPYITRALKKEVYLLATSKYSFLGQYRECLRMFGRMIREFPDDVDALNEYGVILLTIGKNDRAKPVYERVLQMDPENSFAKVHLGFIVKAEGDWHRATELLRSGLEANAPGTRDGKFYFHLGDALYRIGEREEAGEWYQRGADMGFFFSKYQRSLYNVDRLKSRPFWTAKQAKVSEIVKKLETNWKTIRNEALKVMNVEEGLFLHEEESLKNTGEWRQFTLYTKGQKGKDCDRTPKTCALVSKMTAAASCKRGQIKYSIMMPGTHVWPHTGPTNCRLRMHLGLVIPKTGNGTRLRCADETRTWEEGKVLIFDDSFEHEVWQDAESYRLIFIIDIWHPDLTDRERKSLSPI